MFLFCQNHKATLKKRQEPLSIAQKNVLPERVSDIILPQGFIRKKGDQNSFCFWLQNLKLKKDNTVYLHNGTKKQNQQAQFAVLDIPVGEQNLQQCADAIMRLRAEYLYSIKNYTAIRFKDNEGAIYQFTEPYTEVHLDKYLQKVFGRCGNASLAGQMKTKKMEDIEPGDVLIRGGFPGHAVIVMDVAENKMSEKIYLLAQSYMPAQDIHILKNPFHRDDNPWYAVSGSMRVETPEYTFNISELKRW